MSLTRHSRQALQRQVESHIAEAGQLLLKEDDLDRAERHLRQAELSERILAKTAGLPRRLYTAVVIAALCLALASFAWTQPKPDPSFRLQAEAKTVLLTLSQPWQAEPRLSLKGVVLDDFTDIEVPGLDLHPPAAHLELEGKKLVLTHLKANADASADPKKPNRVIKLDIELNDGQVHLFLHEGHLSGEIDIQDGKLHLKRDEGPISTEVPISTPRGIPETLTFNGSRYLRLRLLEDWHLRGFQITGIDFELEDPPNSGRWVSSILAGTLEFPEAKRQETLLENDWVKLNKVQSTRLHITYAKDRSDQLRIVLQGSAQSVRGGPNDFVKDLGPSWLEYLYHQEQLAFFWSAVIFLWGLMWSLRNLF